MARKTTTKPNSKGEYKKATEGEIAQRITVFVQMITEGYSRADMVRYAAKKWKVSARQVDTYCSRANEAIEAEAAEIIKNVVATSLRRYSTLYQKNYKSGDFREAASVVERITKLTGAGAATKVDLTTKGESLNKTYSDYLMEASQQAVIEPAADQPAEPELEGE